MSKREQAIKTTTDILKSISRGIEQPSMTRHRAANMVDGIVEAVIEKLDKVTEPTPRKEGE
jgi:hypothetical protein